MVVKHGDLPWYKVKHHLKQIQENHMSNIIVLPGPYTWRLVLTTRQQKTGEGKNSPLKSQIPKNVAKNMWSTLSQLEFLFQNIFGGSSSP